MEQKILAHASISQTKAISFCFLSTLKDYPLKDDQYLQELIQELEKEDKLLIPAIIRIKKEALTDELKVKTSEFLKIQSGLFLLLKSYRNDLDDDIKESTKRIWRFAKNQCKTKDLASRIATAYSMINKFRSEEYVVDVARLPGLKRKIEQYETCTEVVHMCHFEKINNRSNKEKIVPGNITAGKIRTLINNQIMPYISTMSKVKGGTYEHLLAMLSLDIAKINQEVRMHRKRNFSQ